ARLRLRAPRARVRPRPLRRAAARVAARGGRGEPRGLEPRDRRRRPLAHGARPRRDRARRRRRLRGPLLQRRLAVVDRIAVGSRRDAMPETALLDRTAAPAARAAYPLLVLRLAGSQADMGRQHGELLAAAGGYQGTLDYYRRMPEIFLG